MTVLKMHSQILHDVAKRLKEHFQFSITVCEKVLQQLVNLKEEWQSKQKLIAMLKPKSSTQKLMSKLPKNTKKPPPSTQKILSRYVFVNSNSGKASPKTPRPLFTSYHPALSMLSVNTNHPLFDFVT